MLGEEAGCLSSLGGIYLAQMAPSVMRDIFYSEGGRKEKREEEEEEKRERERERADMNSTDCFALFVCLCRGALLYHCGYSYPAPVMQ